MLQMAEDLPEQRAMHHTLHALAGLGIEADMLGVFEVMCDLVEIRVEEIFYRTPPGVAIVGIDPHELSFAIIPAQHPCGRTSIHVDFELDLAMVDSPQTIAEQRSER